LSDNPSLKHSDFNLALAPGASAAASAGSTALVATAAAASSGTVEGAATASTTASAVTAPVPEFVFAAGAAVSVQPITTVDSSAHAAELEDLRLLSESRLTEIKELRAKYSDAVKSLEALKIESMVHSTVQQWLMRCRR
jgi:hypothetical protein